MSAAATIGGIEVFQRFEEEIRRQLDSKHDYVVDTRRASFQQDETGVYLDLDIQDGAQSFPLTRHAHGQMAQRLDLPFKTYERLRDSHAPLFTHLTSGLLAREPKKRLFRTLDGHVRAVLSNRYRPRDNYDLLTQVVMPELSSFPERLTFKQATLTETRMYVKVVFPGIEKPVRVGDVVRAGLIIQNSEVGVGKLGIYPYTDRLICTNGQVHTDFGQGTRHVGKRIDSDDEEAWEVFSDETMRLDDEAFFAKSRDTLKAVLNASVFDAIVSQMQDLAGLEVTGAPDQVIEVFASRHNLTDGEQGSMLSALIDEGDRSAWGYVNALTRTARDTDDADRQTDLEKLAGSLTADPSWVASLN